MATSTSADATHRTAAPFPGVPELRSGRGALDRRPFPRVSPSASICEPAIPARRPPDLALTPTKQHFVDSVEILCDTLLLFLEVLDLEILLVEPPAAEHQSFVPPLARQVLALLVDIEIIFLVSNEDRLTPAAHVHIETDNDVSVGKSDSSVGEAMHAPICRRETRPVRAKATKRVRRHP
jgi:hypothetical protein